MIKSLKSKFIILYLSVFLFCTLGCFADADIDVHLETNVGVNAQLEKSGFNISSGIDPLTGNISSPIYANYNLETNSNSAADFDFFISATLPTVSNVSAFAEISGQMALMFANASATTDDIDSVESGTRSNNIIPYGTNVSLTYDSTVSTFTSTPTDHATYGTCYLIKAYGNDPPASGAEGSITFSVNTSPISGMYNFPSTPAGNYSATITVTAWPKH